MRYLHKHIISMLTAVMLSLACGCTHDDPGMPDPNDPRENAIGFEATVNGSDSRSGRMGYEDLITTENIRDFNVCAYSPDNPASLLMDNVTVHRVGPNSWFYSPLVEWPVSPVNFLAVSPATFKITTNHWWWHVINFKANGEARTDMVVAVRNGAVQSDGRIRLNFRHAMARVHLDIAADIPSSSVVLKGIDMFTVDNGGDFLLPRESTYPKDSIGQLDNCWAPWTQDQTNQTIPYFRASDGEELTLSSTPVDPANLGNHFYVPFNFIPLTVNNEHIYGTAIRLICRIVNAATGEKLWPNDKTDYKLIATADKEYGYIFFALYDVQGHRRWRPGHDYTYHVTVRNEGVVPPEHSEVFPADKKTRKNNDARRLKSSGEISLTEKQY